MSKKILDRMLQGLHQEGLLIDHDRIEIFIEDSENPVHVDRRKTESLKNKVFKRIPSGWGGLQSAGLVVGLFRVNLAPSVLIIKGLSNGKYNLLKREGE
jgi:hypothetical protein